MLLIGDRIESFVLLGQRLRADLEAFKTGKKPPLEKVMQLTEQENPWFTLEKQESSILAILEWLQPAVLGELAQRYFLSEPAMPRRVLVIMAGNIPMVNFHDFLSVLLTGNRFLGKLSSQDRHLLPYLSKLLVEQNPLWENQMVFTEERLDSGVFDAVIATGSNNSSRYFEYYFGKYPHIIRRNRNSVALINGHETKEELKGLYNDIFQFYGMGCRNVSMLMVPMGYNLPQLFDTWEGLQLPTDHYKYRNNYDYYRSIYLVNLHPFFDTGYVSVLKSESIASPVSVLHYKEYEGIEEVSHFIKSNKSKIQCVVSTTNIDGVEVVPPGKAQSPEITDFPDGTDIIQFLLAL